MTPELTYLLYAVILLIAHIIVQATLSDLSKGLFWALGSQDEPREQNVIAGRVQRALRNYLETFPAFVALVFLLTAAEAGTGLSATGAELYFLGAGGLYPGLRLGHPACPVGRLVRLDGRARPDDPRAPQRWRCVTPELTYVVYACALILLHAIAQGTTSALSKGFGWALGSRDETREQGVIAGRMQRAFVNLLETFPVFAVLALVLAVTERSSDLSATGAALYFWGRVVFVPAALSGIPLLRTCVWFVTVGGLCLMIYAALTGGAP